MLHLEENQENSAAFCDKRRLAIWILAKSPNFGDFAKNPNHDFALVIDHGRVRLVDVVLGQLSGFLNSFGKSWRYLLNFGISAICDIFGLLCALSLVYRRIIL